MSIVYFTKLRGDSCEFLMEKLSRVSQKEAARILSLRFEIDRQRCIAGKLLLLHALNQNGICKQHFLPDLHYNAFGKPHLKGYPIDFNISHSGDIIACSYIENGLTGIDVEQIEPVEFSDYTLVFSESEMNRIVISDCPIMDFYQIWTSKEAIMKAEGSGFSLDPLTIQIDHRECVIAKQKWSVTSQVVEPGYMMSVASNRTNVPTFEFVPVQSLYS